MFPIFKNKKFYDLITGKIVTIIDQFEDVAVLEGKQRLNINKLLDKSLYEEYIDPNTFFTSGSLQVLADKIKSIPNDVLSSIKEEESESIVMPYDPEEEKRLILEKARAVNPANSMVNQMEKFRGILDDESVSELPVKSVTSSETRTQLPVTSPEQNENSQQSTFEKVDLIVRNVEDDPIVKLFKNVKRKQDFSFSFTVENKIPRPDFIEMMEDSYEYSLIDFLAEEFTQNILSDSESIKEKIKSELTELVYNRDKKLTQTDHRIETKIITKKPKSVKNKKEDDSSVVH